MAIVYLEELTKHVQNKYLAVNVIAKRARSINDELLGAGFAKKQKPVTIATDELAAGDLTYKKIDPDTSESEINTLFTSESEDYDAVEVREQIPGLFGEDTDEGSSTEEDTEENAVDEDADDTEKGSVE